HAVPYTDVALLALVDPDGVVVAADPSSAVGATLSDAPYVAAARDATDLAPAVVSDLLPAAADAPSTFALARPVRRPAGAPVGVLVAYVDTSALGRVLPLDRLDRSRGALVDRQGRLVYDSEHPDLLWPQRDVSALPLA